MVNIKHHEISLWCHYNGPKLCSLHHFRPLMSWTLSHCRSRTISDHYRPEFPDKTLSIDFLSFNILIQNEQLATNKQLKKHPLNICTYRLLYLPFVVIFLHWLMYHTHDAGPLSWVDVTECPRSAVGWGETGEIVNHILHCVLIFVSLNTTVIMIGLVSSARWNLLLQQ